MTSIAIIGAGRVGSTLGRRWAEGGHAVTFGVRTPDDPDHDELRTLPGVRIAPVADAGAGADVVVIATPHAAAGEAVAAVAGSTGLDGVVVVDATNPIAEGMGGLTLGTTTSGAEQLAALVPGARVVKAFNTTGAGNMADPAYPGGALAMLLCGDDEAARAVVGDLAADLGFEPVDAGPLRSARYLEPFAMTWITLAYRAGLGPDVGFALLRR